MNKQIKQELDKVVKLCDKEGITGVYQRIGKFYVKFKFEEIKEKTEEEKE